MRNTSLFVIAFFAMFSPSPVRQPLCACCAEHGQYINSTDAISEYEMELLKKISFDKNVELSSFQGMDGTKGLKSIEKDYNDNDWQNNPQFFTMTHSFDGKSWNLAFKTVTGKTGTLQLAVPKLMTSLKIDIHDQSDSATMVFLYKEWRFKGTVSAGTGFFQAGITKPVSYLLIFQGRGNNCDNAEDYKNWRLEIKGPNADYAFIGQLNNDIE